ncbi:MAG TPA: glycerophosphodiester phosphodiesterase family protein [Pyrinomonadaceae bacterium]|nr:glycerophosphodiester phosphodiesterase family protein [Pyrinomonadaceae bacterium]
MPPRPLMIAHRGASAEAPENTIAAFQLAIDAGADGVEFDVRLTKDGIPAVIHDADLRRIAKRKDLVNDLTAAELASIASVPTLADVLGLYPSRGIVHIELKIDKKRESRPLVEALAETIRHSPVLPRIVVSSFHLPAIAEAKFMIRELRTSALFAPAIMRVLKRRRHMIALARSFDADGISPHRSLITRKFAWLAAEAVMPVTVWTCDNTKWISRCRDLGIPAMITNDPRRLILARESSVE